MHPLQMGKIAKRPNRKIYLFLQTNKTYSQVQDVANGGMDWISTLIFTTPEQSCKTV